MTPELNAKVAEWRRKEADGTITLEDMKEAIKWLAQGRTGAHIASTASRTKKIVTKVENSDDLFAELEGL